MDKITAIVRLILNENDKPKNIEVYQITGSECQNAGNVPPNNAKKGGCLSDYSRVNVFILFTLLVVLMALIGLLAAVVVWKVCPENIYQKIENGTEKYIPAANYTSSNKVTDVPEYSTTPGILRIVSRAEWVANPPKQEATRLNLPVPYVIIMHTATVECSSRTECNSHVKYIQMFHMENRHWWDIGYNFLVGGDGNAYEGRGWIYEGSHTRGYNARSIGITFIGTFIEILPPRMQMTACKQLIDRGVELGHISKDYKLLAARQIQTTESPGAMLYEEIKKWPHWSSSP